MPGEAKRPIKQPKRGRLWLPSAGTIVYLTSNDADCCLTRASSGTMKVQAQLSPTRTDSVPRQVGQHHPIRDPLRLYDKNHDLDITAE